MNVFGISIRIKLLMHFRNLYIKKLLLWTGICFSVSSVAQIYPTRTYSTLDGLPTNSIFDITQDPNGLMWFVTPKGAVSYDGQKWAREADSLSLPNSVYSRIQALEDGSIWVAGQDEFGFKICYKRGQEWSSLLLPDSIKRIKGAFPFEVILKDGKYVIWLADNYNLYQYSSDVKIWSTIVSDININAIIYDSNGPFLCTDNGLYQLKESVEKVVLNSELPNDQVLSIAKRDSNYYILGFDWLAIAKEDSIYSYWEKIGMRNPSRFKKYDLIVDHRNRIFYNCNSPIQVFNRKKGKGEILETKDRIRNANSISIFEDAENNIWVGDYRGLFRFNQLRFKNYNREIGLLQDEVSAIIQTKDGKIVLANTRGISFLTDEEITESFKIPVDPTEICRILDIVEEKDRLILACGPSGLIQFKNGKFSRFKVSEADDTSFVSVEKWNGKIYAVSGIQGIFEVIGNRLVKRSSLMRIRNLNAVNDTLMVGNTMVGVFLITATDTSFISSPSSSRDLNNCFSSLIWNNRLLVGTNGGLVEIKNGKYVEPPILNLDLPIYSLLKDDRNNLWIGTNDGIIKWDSQEIRRYNRSHGLIGSETNRNALIQDKQGKIWVGMELGASSYDEKEDLTLALTPKLKILSVRDNNGASYDPDSFNEIPNGISYLDIAVRGISFIDENKISYRYKLVGLDQDWQYLPNSNNTEVRYTNLQSGNYRFLVQSRIEQEKWSDSKSTSFLVLSPFYSTWWFVATAIFILVLGLYFFYRIRFIYFIRRQNILREQVRQRTRQITVLNESLERKVALRTQKLMDSNQRLSEYAFMNAHLLRGPLTRIQSLTKLLEIESKHVLSKSQVEILKEAADEMDDVIHSINRKLRDEVDLKNESTKD